MSLEKHPRITVITPNYNQVTFIEETIQSVINQNYPNLEYIIIDGGSTDGSLDIIKKYKRKLSYWLSEKDNGMYDAINCGWERAPEDVDLIAHLNCDEQYLPNALLKVANCFKKHPKDDVVYTDMIVVDGDGEYICHRRPLPPWPIHSRLFIPGFTCTTFQRRSVFFDKGCRFDTSWKNLGDMIWNYSLFEKGCRFRMLNEYTSLFADTGDNLNLMESGTEERQRYYATVPRWMKAIRPAVFLHKRMRYALRMFFSKTPRTYSLFLSGNEKSRVEKRIENPTCVWTTRKQWRNAMVQK